MKKFWSQPMSNSPMVLLHRKLKRLKQSLKSFNKDYFSNISPKLKEKRIELAIIQEEILFNTSVALVETEKRLTHEML